MLDRENYGNSNNFPAGHHLAPGLTKQQKIGLVVLAVFALAVFIFWYLELNKRIVYPLYGGNSPAEVAKKAANQAVGANQPDTDKDGLSDNDEFNIYQTSPFLSDSDGDGLSDKEEVVNGSDPNCPQGKTCAAGELAAPAAGQNQDLLNNPLAGNAAGVNQAGTAGVQTLPADQVAQLKAAFGEQPDPKTLRDALVKAATKEEDKQTLQNLTDAQLLQLYAAMIGGLK